MFWSVVVKIKRKWVMMRNPVRNGSFFFSKGKRGLQVTGRMVEAEGGAGSLAGARPQQI